jgi:hypothetical protein
MCKKRVMLKGRLAGTLEGIVLCPFEQIFDSESVLDREPLIGE